MRNYNSLVWTLLVSATLCLGSPTFAGEKEDVEKAESLIKSQDYAAALKILKPLAEDKGIADCQFHLGVMYEEGKGVPKDDKEAAKWYEKAAAQGHKHAT